ncbi:aldo/keto reductase [Rhizosphaericola mali]|uniref:Aldo/keto reductase n=1 Tax=Rhizosphaericola mali TaxID=2545455 RepID=A0A5P2G8B8_9BACT|nr:aldo/keto reductase [Rhizosphaericola mali]
MNKTFKLGGDLEINRVGYGAMQLTGKGEFGEVEDRENAKNVLLKAVEFGVNFIDTAEAYGPKYNESLISDALYPYKQNLVIATKGGFLRPEPFVWIPNGNPDHIRENIESSLKRLKTDSIDLWQLHRIDPNVPIEKTIVPILEAYKDGKIKHFGLSEVTVEQIEKIREYLPVVSVQNLYNLGDRRWEDVLDYTIKENIAFIPWYPLASGPNKMAGKLQELSLKYNSTIAQIALSWLLKRGSNILLIPGTKSIQHLEENLKADSVSLTEEDYNLLLEK